MRFKIDVALLGFLLGAVAGYLLRPSLMGVQLPFLHVVTRGMLLEGMDTLLLPLAQTSFNYMLAAAVIGVFLGIVIDFMRQKQD